MRLTDGVIEATGGDLLTTAEAAARTGLPPKTVAAWVGAGDVPVRGVCRSRSPRGDYRPAPLVDPADVLAHAAALARCAACAKPFAAGSHHLCWGCRRTPAVREAHRRGGKFTRHGAGVVADFVGPRPLPAEPTEHPPGTAEKLAVLEKRAAACEHLFHPADAREPGDELPRRWRERRGA